MLVLAAENRAYDERSENSEKKKVYGGNGRGNVCPFKIHLKAHYGRRATSIEAWREAVDLGHG